MSEVTISAVSGTYNRLALLQRMVASVRQSVGSLSYEIILVDGGSTDGTLEWCKSQADVVLIEQGELLGAIKAFNAGFKIARGHYVAILNDDITVDGNTLTIAANCLDAYPGVGMVAFENIVKGNADPHRAHYSMAFKYLYGQCCLVRRWLGDWADWWGNEGMKTYGGDTRLSLRLWEMGWPTTKLKGCSITDYVHDDALRQANNASWATGMHSDVIKFNDAWKGRLPIPNQWIPASFDTVLGKAIRGNLRTLRFKAMYRHTDDERTGMVDAFAQYGPTRQVNQNAETLTHGVARYQSRVAEIIDEFKPDLVMFQARSGDSLYPDTAKRLRDRYKGILFANFDGDTRYPLREGDFAIARAVHLQLVISPSLFSEYAKHGAGVVYWPIAPEQEFLDVMRSPNPQGPDVIFLGSLFGLGAFPCAEARRDAVLALMGSGLAFKLLGHSWDKIGIKAEPSYEKFASNAQLYAGAKMALSISQASDLWGYTSDRLYNICATGCPALVQRFAGMEEHGFVDGETCIAWSTVKEMLDKTHYYLEHADEREAIGAAGRKLVHNRHTWAHRVEALFAIIEGLKGDK